MYHHISLNQKFDLSFSTCWEDTTIPNRHCWAGSIHHLTITITTVTVCYCIILIIHVHPSSQTTVLSSHSDDGGNRIEAPVGNRRWCTPNARFGHFLTFDILIFSFRYIYSTPWAFLGGWYFDIRLDIESYVTNSIHLDSFISYDYTL